MEKRHCPHCGRKSGEPEKFKDDGAMRAQRYRCQHAACGKDYAILTNPALILSAPRSR